MSRLLTPGKPSCEALCQRTYGCTVAEYWVIRGVGPYRRSPVEKFVSQRKAADDRGIAWEFDLQSWWKVWLDSGLWHQRSRYKSGYVMARVGDVGPYSPDNVFICEVSQNCRESLTNKPRTNAGGAKQLGKGRGWTFLHRNKSNPYQVICGKKYVGIFPTQLAAEAAYRAAVQEAVAR